MRNIIIYNKDSKLDNLPSYKKTDYIHYDHEKLYDLYDGRFINPPFFDKIYVVKNNLTLSDLQMIYNMLYSGGTIIFLDKYEYFFKTSLKKLKNNFSSTIKKDNFIYQFTNSRTVDFLIMGTQKGGTTALSLNISKHPDIFIDRNPDPAKSEVHFFDINWNKGLEWYKKKFNYSKKMVGEKTPELMYLDYTFPLIQSINPYVKIIIILRNPMMRAYSAWKHALHYGETRTFEEAINEEKKNKLMENKTFYTAIYHYLQRGLYYKQIMNIIKWFSKNNLLILINEEVIDNMSDEYNRVYKFLNLKEFTTEYKLEYVSKDKRTIDNKTYNSLIDFFKKDIKQLEKFISRKTGWLN